MRHRPDKRGFTIIETMIFLTVSAVVFLGAIQQYSGQQRVVLANQGIRTLQSQLTSMANEVASSFTTNLGTDHCHAATDGSNGAVYFNSSGSDNSDCIYLGKAFSFGAPSYCTNVNADTCGTYTTAPIVGRRLIYVGAGDKGTDVATYGETKPVVPNLSPSLVETKTLLNGIGIRKAFIRNATGGNQAEIGGFAFILSLTGDGGSSGQTDLVALSEPFINNTAANTPTAVAALVGVTPLTTISLATLITRINPQYGIALCLLSGDDQSTEITVGANNSPVDVQVVPTGKIDTECTT